MTTHTDNAWLDKWWWETNGTGTDACTQCYRPDEHICTWHQARLNDLAAHIDTVCREAIKEAVDYYAWRFECNTAVSEMYGWKGTLETAKDQTLRHFEATQLNPNKDTKHDDTN